MTSVPPTMRAAFVRALGGPELIEHGELPTPRPGPTDVLVRMAASGVDRVDLFVRSGAYRTPTPLPFVLGRDLVGEVVEVGPGASGPEAPGAGGGPGGAFDVGDRVWCNSLGHGGRQGALAEYAVVPADRLYRLPDGVDPVVAAATLHGAATAHLGLFREAGLRPGETVLVGGGGGAVGGAAVRLAAEAGARVLATTSPPDAARARRLGAHAVLDHTRPDLPAQVEAAQARDGEPPGVDVWWDTSGRQDLAAAVPLLRRRGRLVVSAGLRTSVTVPAGALYARDASVRGFAISNATTADLAAAAVAVNRLLASGPATARVAETVPLAEAARAHRRLEAGGVRGRLVVVP